MNRMMIGCLGFFFMAIFFSGFSWAEVIEVEVNVPAPTLWQDDRGFTHVQMEGYSPIGESGDPALPSRSLNILIPPGQVVESVQVIAAEPVEIPSTVVIFPKQKPRPLSLRGPRTFSQPNPIVYESDQAYPSEMVSKRSIQRLRGFSIQPLVVTPLEYRPQSGTLAYIPSLVIELRTVSGLPLGLSKPAAFRGLPRDFDRVSSIVSNPEILARYPHRSPRVLEGQTQYVIITNRQMFECTGDFNLGTLAADKQGRGLTTLTKLVEDIQTDYPGKDDAEKVRNFIIDMYTNAGTEYVLLAGDADKAVVGGETEAPVVPIRELWVDIEGFPDFIPSDLYMAALDGDFNADQDAYYGEPADEPDLFAEVHVGRAPVDSCTEVANFVRKTLEYQNAAGAWLQDVRMVGEFLFEPDIYAKEYLMRIESSSEEEGISTKGFSESSFFSITWLDDKDLGGPEAWGKAELMPIINSGPHLINHLGHSDVNYNMRLVNEDIDAEMTNTNSFLDYSQGCFSGAVDNRSASLYGEEPQVYPYDSFAEHLLLGEHGAFAVLMNTRFGLGDGYSNAFHRFFWDAAFKAEPITKLGAMQNHSREPLAGLIEDPGFRWVYYTITLFADPEVSVHMSANTDDPMIGLSSNSVKFATWEGSENPADQKIGVTNLGKGSLEWTVESEQSWLSVSPTSGTAPTEITVSVNSMGMAGGEYKANLTFFASSAINSPRAIPVHLMIVPSVVAPFGVETPVVDGVLGADEWAGAAVLELNSQNPGISKAYVLNSGDKLYLALELGSDNGFTEYDYLQLLFDNNNDNLWPETAGDEGEYYFYDYEGYEQMFNPVFGSGQRGELQYSPSGVASKFGNANGKRILELSFDLANSHLKVSPGGAFGMWMSFYVMNYDSYQYSLIAYWPGRSLNIQNAMYFGDVSLGVAIPNLNVTPHLLNFTAIQGGDTTEPLDLTIGATVASSLPFELSSTDPWVVLSKTSGNTNEVVSIAADPSGLEVGTYEASISVSSPDAENSPVEVAVQLEVVPPPPTFGLDPLTLSFQAIQAGTLPTTQQLQITNVGSGALDWFAAPEGDWLSVSAASGTAPSTLEIGPNTTDLAPGSYAGAIVFSGPGAESVRMEIGYEIQVTPVLFVDPLECSRESKPSQGILEEIILVTNEQPGPMVFSVSEESSFVSADPVSGTTQTGRPAKVTLRLDPAGLEAGSHEASIVINAVDTQNAPQTVRLTWNLLPEPILSVDPLVITMQGEAGGEISADEKLRIQNTGTGTLNWNLGCQPDWLICDPNSGTEEGEVTISASTVGMEVGTYNGTIQVTSPELENTPITVDVALVIVPEKPNQAPPQPSLVSPENGVEIEDTTPELVLANVDDPDGDSVTYTFEVYSEGASQPSVVLSDVPPGDSQTSVVLTEPLKAGSQYLWRARAIDNQKLAGEWSLMWQFKVQGEEEPEEEESGGCNLSSSSPSNLLTWFLLGLGFVGIHRIRRKKTSQ